MRPVASDDSESLCGKKRVNFGDLKILKLAELGFLRPEICIKILTF
jgi:hypothetical protein